MFTVDIGDLDSSASRRFVIRRSEVLQHQRLAARHFNGASIAEAERGAVKRRLGGCREPLAAGGRRDENAAERDLVLWPQRSPIERHFLLERRHHGGHHPVPRLSESIRGTICKLDFVLFCRFVLFFHAAALSKKLLFSLYLREKGYRKGTGWGGVSLFVNFCTTFSKCVFFARACFYSSYL